MWSVTVCELIAALAHLPPDHPVILYPGHDAGEVVVAEVDARSPRVLLMERPFDKGDATSMWREWFAAGRAELTCSTCERPVDECRADRCVSDATDAEGNVLT